MVFDILNVYEKSTMLNYPDIMLSHKVEKYRFEGGKKYENEY
jgi:hypothetical protein